MHAGSLGCGDDGAVARQIQGAKDLEAYIDAKAGGPGQGFYRIVYSAAEARAAIYAGKMAVVLGTEVDGGTSRDVCARRTPSSPACEPAALNSSASWSATRTATGSATSAARRESTSS